MLNRGGPFKESGKRLEEAPVIPMLSKLVYDIMALSWRLQVHYVPISIECVFL